MYEMYRLMAIAKYDERYVIPKAHVEQAHDLEEMGCSLDFDDGPGMYGSAPFGEASGRPVPVAVETFHALKQRQTTDEPAGSEELRGRVNLLNWDGNGAPPGLFPAAARGHPMRRGAAGRARGPAGRVLVPGLPGRRARRTGPAAAVRARRAGRCPRSTGSSITWSARHWASSSGSTSTSSTSPAATRSTCPTGPTATPAAAARCWRRFKAAYRDSGFLVDTSGELPDYLPMVLEFAAIADPEAGEALLREYRPSLELLRLAPGRGRRVRPPTLDVLAAVCATLPGASPADRAAVQAMAGGPPTESVGLEPYDPRLLPMAGER